MPRKHSDRSSSACPEPRKGKRRVGVLLASLFVVAVCVATRYYWPTASAKADPVDTPPVQTYSGAPMFDRTDTSEPAERPSRQQPVRVARASSAGLPGNHPELVVPTIVAAVNNRRIERSTLAAECLHRFGNEILESMINKQLIIEECQRRGITVTRNEVNAEIERLARQFRIPVDQWLKLLKQERNVTPKQYADDIIWPRLALQKLAGALLDVTPEELQRDFETRYGKAVRVRLIAVSSLETANSLRAQAVANPGNFDNLAKEKSEDASASAKGIIAPIRQHGSYQEIEDVVFRMRNGEISPVIHVANQYLIFKCEGMINPRPVRLDEVATQLREGIRERKMHTASQEIFRQLHDSMKLVNVWNNPAQRQKMPGVAALVNGEAIRMGDVAEECLARHGAETLESLINHSLLEQACRKDNVTVTDRDIDAEIEHAASMGARPRRDGSPDVEAWLALVTKKQGIPLEIYRTDVVWPTVVLKKLATDKIAITEEDLRKGFDANYGPRVRCLAIVLNNQRQAQEVFEMARHNNTSKNFGDLAEQYSVEPGSQKLRGEVPPIKKYCGQPQLEQEAFSLRPGELSGIIQIADKFIILRCEEYTTPVHVDFAVVRDEIYRELYEKKLHQSMREQYDRIQDAATIDNFLANTSHSPKGAHSTPGAKVPRIRQVSAAGG